MTLLDGNLESLAKYIGSNKLRELFDKTRELVDKIIFHSL